MGQDRHKPDPDRQGSCAFRVRHPVDRKPKFASLQSDRSELMKPLRSSSSTMDASEMGLSK